MPLVAWDIDGTLCRSYVRGREFSNPSALAMGCQPRWVTISRLRRLRARHVLVTGRTEAVRVVTMRQLRDWTGIQHPEVFMQRQWEGMEALREHKARSLREVGAHCFIGNERIDADAAHQAQTPFYYWARHVEKEGLPAMIAVEVAA